MIPFSPNYYFGKKGILSFSIDVENAVFSIISELLEYKSSKTDGWKVRNFLETVHLEIV